MYRYKCIEVLRDNNKKPISYKIIDLKTNQERVATSVEVKENILKGISIENLTLTVDNKLYFRKESNLTLYHGSPNKKINIEFGKGDNKHDYGKGFYLTPDVELAKEWAVSGINSDGYLHVYNLDISKLKVLDFDEYDVLNWIAELMSHRDAGTSVRYRRLAPLFIEKYKKDTIGYDVIKGWRADSSYFYIAKQFVNDNVDVNLLPELLRLGNLGIQYCLKSEKAMKLIKEDESKLEIVSSKVYLPRYNKRDSDAREYMRQLVESPENKCLNTFSTLVKEL